MRKRETAGGAKGTGASGKERLTEGNASRDVKEKEREINETDLGPVARTGSRYWIMEDRKSIKFVGTDAPPTSAII